MQEFQISVELPIFVPIYLGFEVQTLLSIMAVFFNGQIHWPALELPAIKLKHAQKEVIFRSLQLHRSVYSKIILSVIILKKSNE